MEWGRGAWMDKRVLQRGLIYQQRVRSRGPPRYTQIRHVAKGFPELIEPEAGFPLSRKRPHHCSHCLVAVLFGIQQRLQKGRSSSTFLQDHCGRCGKFTTSLIYKSFLPAPTSRSVVARVQDGTHRSPVGKPHSHLPSRKFMGEKRMSLSLQFRELAVKRTV